MTFQTGMLLAMAVMMVGGAIYYFNEEYPERIVYTRLGLVITALGLVMLVGVMIWLRQWP